MHGAKRGYSIKGSRIVILGIQLLDKLLGLIYGTFGLEG
jgi:hypothetical protein